MEGQNPFLQLLIKDGILIGTYKKGLHIDLEMAHRIVSYRMSFTEGKTMPAMIISNGLSSIDRPAREFLASSEGIEGLSATAIVAGSPFSSLMGNFFMMVNKTNIPVKLFSDPGKAMEWLHQFIDNNQSPAHG